MNDPMQAVAERWRRYHTGEMSGLEADEYYHSALLDEDRDALCEWACRGILDEESSDGE